MKTKNRIWICTIILMGLISILNNSCEKDKDKDNYNTSTVTDKDGNVYTSVTIGTQVWMVENLKTTKYSNGDLIGTTTPATLDISVESTPEYQWAHGGNESNVATYGRLYTWYAVSDNRNVCPTGWHIPTDAEWTTLTDYLSNNGYDYYGSGGTDIAKSMAAKSGWPFSQNASDPGRDLTTNNSSGFTALPSGYRHPNGGFWPIGTDVSWWTATEYDASNAWDRQMYYDYGFVSRLNNDKRGGNSVRCLKD